MDSAVFIGASWVNRIYLHTLLSYTSPLLKHTVYLSLAGKKRRPLLALPGCGYRHLEGSRRFLAASSSLPRFYRGFAWHSRSFARVTLDDERGWMSETGRCSIGHRWELWMLLL